MRTINRPIYITMAIVLLLALLAGMQEWSSRSNDRALVQVGQPAPVIELQNVSGEVDTLENYAGKVVFLNFWATWCPYCVEEMPDLQRLHDTYPEVTVLAVNVQESAQVAGDYMRRGGYSFPVLLDEDGAVASDYLVSSYPTTVVVGRDGTVLSIIPGAMDYSQMKQIADAALKGGE